MRLRGSALPTAYDEELLLALRLRDVPGDRIGEVLAEVQSHVAETGEDPRTAFGDPKAYASEVAEALGITRSGWRAWVALVTWRDGVRVLVGAAGARLLGDGCLAVARGTDATFGWPASVATGLGLALLVSLVVDVTRLARRDGDPVTDPRSGADMVPPSPWLLPLMAALLLALGVVPAVLLMLFAD
jgi:hypothetical protein